MIPSKLGTNVDYDFKISRTINEHCTSRSVDQSGIFALWDFLNNTLLTLPYTLRTLGVFKVASPIFEVWSFITPYFAIFTHIYATPA
uniref:Uncharacterized protein n=1 Tax=Talaromyces marneffei PM1 TaxID=1077442 RepID=A0A093VZL3_TALMA